MAQQQPKKIQIELNDDPYDFLAMYPAGTLIEKDADSQLDYGLWKIIKNAQGEKDLEIMEGPSEVKRYFQGGLRKSRTRKTGTRKTGTRTTGTRKTGTRKTGTRKTGTRTRKHKTRRGKHKRRGRKY